MNDNLKAVLIHNMTENLPTLRKKLKLSQDKLAEMIGVSRSTVAIIERGKHDMSWNLFLSLLLIFIKNKETDKLLVPLEIYTDELNEYIKNASED